MHAILGPEEDMQEERADRRDAEIREAEKASSFFRRRLTRSQSGPIVAEKVAAIEAVEATSSQKLVRPKSHGTASTDTLQEERATATEPMPQLVRVDEALPEPGTFLAGSLPAEAKLTSYPGSSSVDIAGNSSEAHRPYAPLPLPPPHGHEGKVFSCATDWAALMSSVDEVCPVNAAASEASADEPDEDCFLWHGTLTQCGQHKRSGLYIIYDIICYIFQ